MTTQAQHTLKIISHHQTNITYWKTFEKNTSVLMLQYIITSIVTSRDAVLANQNPGLNTV